MLTYEPEDTPDTLWLVNKLEHTNTVQLLKTFTFTATDIIREASDGALEEDGVRVFRLAVLVDGYYKVRREILGLKYDLMLDAKMPITQKTFVAYRNISVFRRIDALIDQPVFVGGAHEGALPINDFALLLKTFPTTTEVDYYARSRIERSLKDYYGTLSDSEQRLRSHLARKKRAPIHLKENLIAQFELPKFKYILGELQSMLRAIVGYDEEAWQNKIADLLLLIFPKYIAVLHKVRVADFYSKPGDVGSRVIDLMLVDANGSVDILELKQPFPAALLSNGKYRDNHTPKGELSGAVMQAEKYLFHLSKWGYQGEEALNKRYKDDLPPGLKLKVTNPKAIILVGRDEGLSDAQRFDFEIIRRKYANVVDIMTYDDLLRRIENIIVMMERKASGSASMARLPVAETPAPAS